MTSASASPASTPSTRSAAQVSSVPRSQEARCAAPLDQSRRGARYSRRTASCSPASPHQSPAAEARPVSFGARRSTTRNSPQRCAARKPSARRRKRGRGGRPTGGVLPLVREPQQQRQPDRREDELRRHLGRQVDDDAGRGGRGAGPRRTSRWARTTSPPTCATGSRAFIGFPDPAQPDEGGPAGTPRGVDQRRPAQGGEQDLRQVQGEDGEDAPARGAQQGEDLRRSWRPGATATAARPDQRG